MNMYFLVLFIITLGLLIYDYWLHSQVTQNWQVFHEALSNHWLAIDFQSLNNHKSQYAPSIHISHLIVGLLLLGRKSFCRGWFLCRQLFKLEITTLRIKEVIRITSLQIPMHLINRRKCSCILWSRQICKLTRELCSIRKQPIPYLSRWVFRLIIRSLRKGRRGSRCTSNWFCCLGDWRADTCTYQMASCYDAWWIVDPAPITATSIIFCATAVCVYRYICGGWRCTVKKQIKAAISFVQEA